MEATANNYVNKKSIPFRHIKASSSVLSLFFTAFISNANQFTKAIDSDVATYQIFTSVCVCACVRTRRMSLYGL